MNAWLLVGLLSVAPSVHPRPLRVGQWATYRLEGAYRAPLSLRLAAVENSSGTGIWLELEAGLDDELREPLLQLKLLCELQGSRLTGRIQRAIAVVGHGSPQEVSHGRWQLDTQGIANRMLLEARSSWGPPERVDTVRGPLQARPWSFRVSGKRVEKAWFSDLVPLLGLVRWESPAAGQALQLRSFGENAVARVPLPLPSAPPSR